VALVELLERRRLERPGDDFLYAGGETWSAARLADRADACAAALAAAGVQRGHHVALMLENSADFLACFFGVAKLGAVAVTLNPGLRGDTLAYILDHSDARVLVLEGELAGAAAAAIDGASRLETIWARGCGAGHVALEEQLDGRRAAPEPVKRGPGECTAILYTSGTTGRPKGVMLTDYGYERASRWFVEGLRLSEEDVLHTCLPLFHINAQQLSLCGALTCGARLALDRRFSASGFWRSISEYGVTSFNLIGAMLGILHAQAPRPEECAHRARVACVSPVPAAIYRECEERFGVMLLDGYGLTETTPGNTYNPYGQAREGSCGKPAPYIELCIAAEEGEPLPPRTPGEILIRAKEPNVFMLRYYKDREATERAFQGGWFRTGDRGYLDEDGYLYFLDRLKDVIRRRGENISPVEIERAVLAHPHVAEAAAVGVPSDLVGGEEEIALFVLARPGIDDLDPRSVLAVCEERLAAFMVPRYLGVLDEFPRTETQRVQKFALRERGPEGCFDRTAAGTS
jgi:crotonobetaine/carnitine-CoA ligase